MKRLALNVVRNELFIMLAGSVLAYSFMMAAIITFVQVPPDSILDSGLDQVLLVFEEYPD